MATKKDNETATAIKGLQEYIKELDRSNKEYIERMQKQMVEMTAQMSNALLGGVQKEPEITIPEEVVIKGEDFVKLMQNIKEVADIIQTLHEKLKV